MNILASLNSERETERKGQPAGVRYGAVHLIMSKGPVKFNQSINLLKAKGPIGHLHRSKIHNIKYINTQIHILLRIT